MLDDVQCSGSESQLVDCTSAGIQTVSSNCGHSDDAGVRCSGMYLYKKYIYILLVSLIKDKFCVISFTRVLFIQ